MPAILATFAIETLIIRITGMIMRIDDDTRWLSFRRAAYLHSLAE